MAGDIAVEMIDEGRVEAFLGLNRWPHEPPYESPEPPLERAVNGWCARRKNVPGVIDRCELLDVVRRGRLGNGRQPLHLLIEGRQGTIVEFTGVGALAI